MKNLIFIFLLVSAAVYSQENKYEKIKALKTAYITEQLALTPSEAEKFWPVYNKFDEKFHDLRHKKYDDVYKKLHSGIENLTDEEANKLIDDYLSMESNKLEMRKEKIAALRKVLSPKKIIGLRKAEDDFKRELLTRYRHGQGKNQSPMEKGTKRP
ncbi:hypothetical protein [Aequorivita viscosa]|uniref:LTXXQ motif family protein n=1 Tax=Aequorivita viscosa TaxID=797419 RepID=A0A1M6JF22_9FLAO|nr:hypothetical protein [Aequorivita viscosa]SDX10464.1 hypothetical protein SAMN05216556_11735 [Aequorivita viscosa]SHJ45299.1 hypothetical protein SAMN04487908_11735 [Aequorivita viscosa]